MESVIRFNRVPVNNALYYDIFFHVFLIPLSLLVLFRWVFNDKSVISQEETSEVKSECPKAIKTLTMQELETILNTIPTFGALSKSFASDQTPLVSAAVEGSNDLESSSQIVDSSRI